MRTEQERSFSTKKVLNRASRPLAAAALIATGSAFANNPPSAIAQDLPRITYYDCIPEGFCGDTASGWPVEDGKTAACGSDYELGDVLSIDGVGVRTCTDEGKLAPRQIDVFYYSASEAYGQPDYADVEVIGYDPCVLNPADCYDAIQYYHGQQTIRSTWHVVMNQPQEIYKREDHAA